MILLLLAAVSDPDLMSMARAKLAATCASTACASEPSDGRYRIVDGFERSDTAKDRAIGDDGSKCNVVGARRCTKRGRTLFRTDFSR